MSSTRITKRLGLVFIGVCFPAYASSASGQTNVLFVGNSFTFGNTTQTDPVSGSATTVAYYNNSNVTDEDGTSFGGMPGIFKAFTTAANLSYNVSIEAVSGQDLQYHESSKTGIIGQSKWNTVVLQDLSTILLPDANTGDRYSNHSAGGDLQRLVKSSNTNANLLLYQTWAYPAALAGAGYSANTAGLKSMQTDLSFGNADTYKSMGLTASYE